MRKFILMVIFAAIFLFWSYGKHKNGIVTGISKPLTVEEKMSFKMADTMSGIIVLDATLDDSTKIKVLAEKEMMDTVNFPAKVEIHSDGFCGCPPHVDKIEN